MQILDQSFYSPPYQYFSGPLTDKKIIATECIVKATASGSKINANGKKRKKKDCHPIWQSMSYGLFINIAEKVTLSSSGILYTYYKKDRN